MSICVGDLVRSYDFNSRRDIEGTEACYIEGVVQEIVHVSGCERYKIRCTRRIIAGVADSTDINRAYFPPVNGMPTAFGGLTSFVEKIL
jgi:hypothetical protein